MNIILFLFSNLLTTILTINTTSNDTIGWICIVQMILNAIIVIRARKELISVSLLFLLFSYLVHMGQYILNVLNFDVTPSLNLFTKLPEDSLLAAGKFSLYGHTCLTLGILLFSTCFQKYTVRFSKKQKCSTGEVYLNKKVMRFIALLFIAVGLFFSVITTIDLIKLMLQGGYYNTFAYQAENNGIKTMLGHVWELGVIILMSIEKDNKGKCRALLIASAIYLFVIMLTGGRMMALMNIAMLLFFYFKFIERPKTFGWMLWIFIGYFALEFVVSIGLNRISGFRDIESTSTSVLTLLGNILGEFGGTNYTVALALEHFPQDTPFGYGLTYLLSLIYILPNFGYNSWDIMSHTSYVDYVKGYTTSGLGGSYIGEAYYNFGYSGLILIVIFGCFLAWYDKKIIQYLKEKNTLKVLAYFGTMPYVFMITRSYFKDMIRPFVWIMLGAYVLYNIFSKKGVKKT